METKEKMKKGRHSTATVRKASKHGEHTQKMMSFRLDLDNEQHLAKEANKGRLINELLRQHYKQA